MPPVPERPRMKPDAADNSRLGRGPWAAFRRRHLPDYAPPAARLWLALVLLGGASLGLAVHGLAGLAPQARLPVALGLALVAAAACLPVRMPPGDRSVTVADLVVYLLLALYGPAAAVLAAAVDGWVGARRTSKRLSSHLGSPAISALALGVAGLAHGGALAALQHAGLALPAAQIAALALAAVAHGSVATTTMLQLLSLKHGQVLQRRAWLTEASWIAALQLGWALFAALLSQHALQHGLATLATGVAVMAAMVVLLRLHMQAHRAAQAEQETRVAVAEAESHQNARRFRSAFDEAAIGMAIVAANGRVLQVNTALQQLLGRSAGALREAPFEALLVPADAAGYAQQLEALLQRRCTGFTLELRCVGAGGAPLWVQLHGALFDDTAPVPGAGPGPDARPAAAGCIFQLIDIDARRHAEQQLRHIAYHDTLTGLDNRHAYAERLLAAAERRQREPHFVFAVLMLDLDRFKTVNDSLGHRGGDLLLQAVAQRLRNTLRPGDVAARVGGDEFALLLEHTTATEATARGRALLQAVSAPVRVQGVELQAQASLGLVVADAHTASNATATALDPDALLRDADLAMYAAKAQGTGRLVVFEPGLRGRDGDRLQLETELRRAIAEGRLSLEYQPIFNLGAGGAQALCGFEALARWQHPQRGAVSPAVFIPLAEETGCLHALTAWALDEALRQHAAWAAAWPAAAALVMHVNVSGGELANAGFVPLVLQALQRHGVPAGRLLLEVTESTLMAQREQALGTLNALVQQGVCVGIDDFGTGYSSLAYLSTLPFHCLKIDRSFVLGLAQQPENAEIVRAVISLGRTLRKQVVAEGIETTEQRDQLLALGATQGQGYLLGRPARAEAAAALLRHHAGHDHRSPP